MRFPSLFRLPRYQQFDIKPRYYDPVKEFVEERKRLSKSTNGEKDGDYSASRIRFERRKSNEGMSASLVQLLIALALSALIVGWLYLGDDLLYYSLVLVPVYFFYRFRKKK